MIPALLLLATVSFTTGAPAAEPVPDFQAGIAARTLPMGPAVFAEGGYGNLLWGERKSSADFLYGYVRPYARFETAAVVNRATAAVDLYPISLFGFKLGVSEDSRIKDSSVLDCTQVECQGMVGELFARTELTLGYGMYFVRAGAGYESYAHVPGTRPYYDEVKSLVGAAGGDHAMTTSLDFGARLNEHWMLGARYARELMLDSGNGNFMLIGVAGYRHDDWFYLAGAGAYESPLQPLAPRFVMLIKWTGLKGVGLF